MLKMEVFTMSGLEIASLYSAGCKTAKAKKVNGKKVESQLVEFIKNKKERSKRKQQTLRCIRKLNNVGAYQKIAEKLGKDGIDEQVVRTHWLGELIGKDKSLLAFYHNFILLNKKVFPEPTEFANFPENIKQNLINDANDCLVRVGVIKKVRNSSLTVESLQLVFSDADNTYRLKREKETIEEGFIHRAEKGFLITFHYKKGREIVDEKIASRIENYTQKALDQLNKGEA